jgi:hypothetical protein
MVMVKRSGAESKKTKPFLDIKIYEPVHKKFTIMRESESLLKMYTQFKNDQSELKNLSEDSIIDALIATLNNDADFVSWRKFNLSIEQKKQQTESIETENSI